ncbi:hypothetical protein FSOLCH5_005575 [Fusarium solani]
MGSLDTLLDRSAGKQASDPEWSPSTTSTKTSASLIILDPSRRSSFSRSRPRTAHAPSYLCPSGDMSSGFNGPRLLTVNGKLRHHSSRGFADGGVGVDIHFHFHFHFPLVRHHEFIRPCLARLPCLLIDEDPLPRGFLDPSGKA